MSVGDWPLVAGGLVIVAVGIVVLRYRVPLAKWQQAKKVKNAMLPSGPLGPGRITPVSMAIIAAGWIIIGVGWIAGAVFL